MSLVGILLLTGLPIFSQDNSLALNRGYRAGYTDGYMAGYTDISEGLSRDVRRHSEYSSANRTYTPDFGKLEDFQSGYRQGFEKGYSHGFEKKPFDSALPTDLRKASPDVSSTTDVTVPAPSVPPVEKKDESDPSKEKTEESPSNETDDESQDGPEVEEEEEEEEVPVIPAPVPTPSPVEDPVPVPSPSPTPVVIQDPAPAPAAVETSQEPRTSSEEIVIASETVLILEMETRIGSEASAAGDRFKAKVVSPLGLTDAIVEGRVARIRQPGRIFRRAEITLVFDRVTTKDGRSAELPAILTEVLPVRTDNVRSVDTEGTVSGKVFDRGDGIRVATVTGSAATVGAIVGGPGGAAIGAGIGALANLASTLSRPGKDITIHPLQQLRIRTTAEIRLR